METPRKGTRVSAWQILMAVAPLRKPRGQSPDLGKAP